MKKLFVVLFALFLIFPLNACAAEPEEAPYIVGVATIFQGSQWEIQKKYYEEELGPKLNMEFVFSEVINDADGLITFMENAYAQGAQGVINYRTNAISQGATKAQELGIYLVNIASRLPAEVKDNIELTYTVGNVGASVVGIGNAYSSAIENVLNDGSNHSIVVLTGAAVGQAAASHYFSTYAILEGMQAKYGLTYDSSIEDLINNATPTEIETGNPDIKIFLVPGLDVATLTNTISPKLQSGEYDVLATVLPYTNYTSLVAEVEQAKNIDIKIIGTTSIEPQTATGFSTLDKFGGSILNAAILNPLNVANGTAALMMFNALEGNVELMKVDGDKPVQLFVNPWVAFNAESYEQISKLDTSSETYVLTGDELLSYAGKNYTELEKLLLRLADLDAIIKNKLN